MIEVCPDSYPVISVRRGGCDGCDDEEAEGR